MPTKSFVPTHHQLITKECYLFSVKLVLFQFGCHDNHENLVIVGLNKREDIFGVPGICLTDCVKSFVTSVSQITEIWQIVSFFIMK